MLEPNERYWNPERRPAVRIVYDNAIGKAEGIRSVAAGDGRIDVVFDLTPDEAKAFHSDKGKVQTKPAKTVLAGVFNESKPGSPWTNVEARRALNMAIDRQRILAHGAYGYGTVIPAFIQPGRYGFDPTLEPYALDVARASQAIDRLGLKGKTVTIVASPTYARVVEEIGRDLDAVGLTLKAVIGKDEPPEGWDIKLEWYFDWSPQYPVGVVHREFFGKSGILRQAPEDPAFDALYEKLVHTVKQPAQEEVVRETERYIHDQAKCPVPVFALHPVRRLGPHRVHRLRHLHVRACGNQAQGLTRAGSLEAGSRPHRSERPARASTGTAVQGRP